jgi:hypothetical protein
VAFNELGLETEGRDRPAFRRNWPTTRAPQSLSALLGRRLGFLESIAGGSHGGTFDPLCRDEAARRSVAGISGIRSRARANCDFSAARSIRSSVLVPLPSLSRLALSADGAATGKIVGLVPEMMNSSTLMNCRYRLFRRSGQCGNRGSSRRTNLLGSCPTRSAEICLHSHFSGSRRSGSAGRFCNGCSNPSTLSSFR